MKNGRILLLIIACIIIVLACTGAFQEVHARIGVPATGYKNVREQFYSMRDNINSDVYVEKNEGLNIEICSYPEDAILFINDLCKSNGMEIEKLRFYRESSLLSEIELVCTYECLMRFIDDVKNKGFNAVVSSVNVFELADGSIDAVVVLNFYDISGGELTHEK